MGKWRCVSQDSESQNAGDSNSMCYRSLQKACMKSSKQTLLHFVSDFNGLMQDTYLHLVLVPNYCNSVVPDNSVNYRLFHINELIIN